MIIETSDSTHSYPLTALIGAEYRLLSDYGPGNPAYDSLEATDYEALSEALTDEDFLRKTQKPGVVVRVRDPEGVLTNGFELGVRTKTEYLAKVLEKRIRTELGST